MRKQYHPQRLGGRILVWDVGRLVDLAKELPIQRVPLSEIWEIDEVRWFDENKYKPTCRALLEHMQLVMAADTSFPILLGSDGRVMDGMHRVLKTALEGGTEVAARKVSVDPEPDYFDVDPDDLPC